MSLTSRAFWVAALERAVRAFAWAVGAQFAADVTNFNAFQADWSTALGIGAGAGVLSILGSLAASHVGAPGPSLANEYTVPREIG